MAATGVIARVVEHLFREVGGDVVKDFVKDASKDFTKDAAKDSRGLADRVLTKDPIDVATREVTLQQTDVELAGLLPLVLARTHLSSYRSGRFFGTSWASTLDQRLDVGSQGISFAAADGMVLAYPHPRTAESVLPERGPRWPLTRLPDGGYTITDPQTGRVLHFRAEFSGTLPLTAISDRNGNRMELVRDQAGVPTEVRHTGGYRIVLESSAGRIVALRLPAASGSETLIRYGYDDAGNLTEVVNSSGSPLRFEYDADARLTGWSDRNGFWYRYEYDVHGRGIRGSGSDGFLNASLSYDSYGRKTTVTDSLGATTVYHFNTAYQVVAETDPLGRTTYREWDPHQRLLSQTDPLNRTTRYDYDAAGNLIAADLPDGRGFTAEYNELNLPTRVVEADGACWHREYDQRGNLIAVTDPLGAVSRCAYDGRGAAVAVTDALGATTLFAADAAGQPVAVTDPLGATTRCSYDALGRLTAAIDAVGGVTRYSWTVEGRLLSRVLPGGATDRWSYDDEGNPVTHIDALGRATRTEYGPFDVALARTGPDGARLEFGYDTELRLTTVTNPQGLVWQYGYDEAGNLLREIDFNGRVLLYGYDAAGQLVKRIDGAGQTVHYLRDVSGNVVEERGADRVVSYSYDLGGRVVRAVNADADVRIERDPLGRVVAESCNGLSLSSAFDPLGRRVRRRTPSGAESEWEYDRASRPVAVRTAGRSLEFEYDAAGREVRRTLGAGAALDQEWDADHRLRRQSVRHPAGEVSQRRTYAYAADGNVVGIDDLLGGSRRFDLDAAGRVTAVDAEDWTERYAYDTAGNLTQASWPLDGDVGGNREYAGTLIRRAGRISYRHDPQGRLVLRRHVTLSGTRRDWRYEWDADDRMVAVTTPSGEVWRYRYDAFGRRIAKQRLGSDGSAVVEEVGFSWDGLVLAEQIHVGSPGAELRATTWDYAPGTFRPIAQARRSALRDAPQEWIDDHFHAIVTDLVGTPAELVDPAGVIGWHSNTSLWGSELPEPREAAYCPLRFPGQFHDDETGLAYNFKRYYDPAIGEYCSADALGLAAGLDLHSYVPNPMVWTDCLGLAPYATGTVAIDAGTGRALSSWRQDVARRLNAQIGGRSIVMPQTAANEFLNAVQRLAGPEEKALADDLMKRVTIVADDPSARAMALNITNKVGANDIVIFGTADKLGVQIFTGDFKFLSGAVAQGVLFDAVVHPPISFLGI